MQCSASGVSFQFPDSAEGGSVAWGRSKRVSAMTTKVILDYVVTTVLAIALGLALSIGAVSLIDKYLGPIDQAEAHYPGAPGQPAR
jgi:uncharacterized membrane protein YqgA involved in biofilm formation